MGSTISKVLYEEQKPIEDSQTRLPLFKDLPLRPEYPPHAAWGVWGDKDELGTVVSHLLPF
jgi:hypothetical protein